jgi:hypothetical protein
MEPTGAGTRMTQTETFSGVLVPLLRKQIDGFVADFRGLNEALRTHVEQPVTA